MAPARLRACPNFPFFTEPDQQVYVTKIYHDCNYLQANEGNIDPQHLSFLHVSFDATDALDPRLNDLVASDVAPTLKVEETSYGLRLYAIRNVGGADKLVRISNFIMPNCATFDGIPLFNPRKEKPEANLGYQIHWHVPIDDGCHWKYTIMYRYKGPIDKEFVGSVFFGDLDEGYRSPRNAQNRYNQSRAEMKRATFAGVGRNFYEQDLMAVESQGRIMDRSNEHLGTTDRAVILMRRQLLKAVDDVADGRDPLFVERDRQADALGEMYVRSEMVPAATDLNGDWWRVPADGLVAKPANTGATSIVQ